METSKPWTLDSWMPRGAVAYRIVQKVCPDYSKRRYALIWYVLAGLIALGLYGGGV